MDTFGWTHAPHVQSASSSRHDDMARPASECYVPMPAGTSAFDLDDAFFGVGFGVQCDGVGGGDAVSSSFDSDLNPSSSQLSLLDCQDAMDLPGGESVLLSSGDMIPSIGRPHDDGLLLDAFALPKNENGGAVSNPIFSSYSSTTGGNVSSGDSNNHGGHDMEVASPCTIAPSLAQTAQLHSKRKLEYPTITTTATTAKTIERPSAKRRAAAATSITFGRSQELNVGGYEPDREAMAQVKEMMYRAAAMRQVNLGEETAAVAAEKPRRKNVRISSDPQTVAARLRRERVSERLRVLQRLVPGGSKMDTASMLDEAASYLKFLQAQVKALETLGPSSSHGSHGRFQLQHYSNAPSVLAFGRDVNGYVKSNRNMQL